MANKCVHRSCGKLFNDADEECHYHPGLPDFHEGQKGWKCCKPRVLTFDEFLAIPPCTTGKHSTVDDTPAPEPKTSAADAPTPVPVTNPVAVSNGDAPPRLPQAPAQSRPTPGQSPAPAPEENDSDEEGAVIPRDLKCKRRGCEASSNDVKSDRSGEECTHHPGVPIFHEGSKKNSCCKRTVLEFEEFLKIPGCKTKPRHCFVGRKAASSGGLDQVKTVRHDFYQTGTTVHASLFLKKIDKDQSTVEFTEDGYGIVLDLRTSDGKWYNATFPLYGKVDPAKSSFKILGTKLELQLAKADGAGWPVLRSDEKLTGEIIQTGKAGRA